VTPSVQTVLSTAINYSQSAGLHAPLATGSGGKSDARVLRNRHVMRGRATRRSERIL
jgi:hypothetical protein